MTYLSRRATHISFVSAAAAILFSVAPKVGAQPQGAPIAASPAPLSCPEVLKCLHDEAPRATRKAHPKKIQPKKVETPVQVSAPVSAASAPVVVDVASQPSAPVATVAPPPPPAPPATVAPPSPQPQYGLAVFDATKPIVLPVARQAQVGFSQEEKSYVDSSDCNYQGFWNAVAHPINAQCVQNAVTKTSSVTGNLGVLPDGKAVFIATGPASLSASETSQGVHGTGYLFPLVSVIGLGIAEQGVDIARRSYHATLDYNNQVTTAINNGKFTSLFGNLSCGNAGVTGSTTGAVNATCSVGSTIVNSAVGAGNAVSGLTSPTTTIATPVAGIMKTFATGFGLN